MTEIKQSDSEQEVEDALFQCICGQIIKGTNKGAIATHQRSKAHQDKLAKKKQKESQQNLFKFFSKRDTSEEHKQSVQSGLDLNILSL